MSDGTSLSPELALQDFRRFRDFIHAQSGIYLEDAKLDSLRISLMTRASRLHMESYDAYLAFLTRDEDEFKELLNLITINETSFFRFPQQFDALRTKIVPEILGNPSKANRTVRVWSAGCSTGEEPYSISMTLLDSGMEQMGWRFQVLGTDVSTNALKRAQTGVYPSKGLVSVPEDVVSRYFEKGEPGWRVADQARRNVDFGYHNLVKEPYPLSLMGNWDIIFCRNVTIYFRVESTRRVVSNFYNSLNEGGYLFIGHSETLSSISDDFEPIEVGGVFLYRKPVRRRPVSLFGTPERQRARGEAGRTLTSTSPDGAVVRKVHPLGTTERMSRRTNMPAPAPSAARPASPDEMPGKPQVDVAALVVEARGFVATGDPSKVHQLVARVLDAEPDNIDAQLLAAYAHADVGDYQAALAACDRALALNPLLPVARYILGIIHLRQGDTVHAVSELKKTIYIDPDFALAHLNLANIYKSQGKWDAAARSYENAMRALYANPDGDWAAFMGGFKTDLVVRTCERSLLECRKAMGVL